ncbi:MAG TPA: metalloregulator ArsR/SmtB family transcription factor [Candidatus Acidoferrales bacterium]|jgi:DNA-binding transcriptional ArsR family regulator|nr:metalloregulator ArsR/SmtB family transcription factor [Candidatus Acidoferrales bacterium]
MLKYEKTLDRVFAALADPTRRAIVDRLCRGPVSMSALAEPLDMSLPAVFQHLKILESSGLVRTAKSGRVRTCHVEPETLSRMAGWVLGRQAAWQQLFDGVAERLTHEQRSRDQRGQARK